MDLQQVLGEVGIGNQLIYDGANNGPKRYPYQINNNGEPMEIKAGPEINRCLDEINQNLEVSFKSQKFKSIFKIQGFQEHMNKIIEGNENEFFIAFRQKMDKIMKDMMDLK